MVRWWQSAFPGRARRAATPTVLQMESVECGAAALAMVLAYHGRVLPLENLRLACGVSRDGCKAGNIVRAARGYGLEAQGMRLDREGLAQQDMPAILFWNFHHFVVLEGLEPQQAWLNDPATGPRKVSREEFDQSYTGVALLFSPGPGFRREGRRSSLAQILAPRLRGLSVPLAYVLIASVALALPGLAVPVFGQIFVDRYLIGHFEGWLKPLLLGMGVTALLRAALTWLQQLYLLRLETRIAIAASAAFMWHVLRLPVDFFYQRYAGDIAQRVDSNNRIALLLSGDLATNAAGLLTLVFYLAIMLFYDWQLSLVCVTLTSLNLLLLRRLSRLRRDGSLQLQQERGKLIAAVTGGIQTMETLKASGAEQDFFMRWAGYRARLSNTEQQLLLYTRLLAAFPLLLSALITAIILGVGGARIMAGTLSVGMLVAFQSMMAAFFLPVRNLMGLASKVQEAQADLVRLDDVLRYPLDSRFDASRESTAAPEAPARLEGYLELRQVCFGYSRLGPPLLQDFDLVLAPGQRVALVGPSGSGKSTVAKLVLGLYQPWSGAVLFDGKPRQEWGTEVMTATLGGIDQEVVLFEGSVRDNLTLWDPTVAESDMVRAAHDAMIHDAVAARPGGYEAAVAEAGANFSGGQRQRLEIARALAGNPRILVMDEATAALDPGTEKEIDERLRRRGCTCLIVAHRLSAIRDCDEIIVMEGGRIVERGTHDALLAHQGAYCRLLGAMTA